MKVSSVHEASAAGHDAHPRETGPQPDASTGTTLRDIAVIGAPAGGETVAHAGEHVAE